MTNKNNNASATTLASLKQLNVYNPQARYCAISLYKDSEANDASEASLTTDSPADTPNLIAILYFLGDYDLLCHKLEAEDNPTRLAELLYKLTIKDEPALPCSTIYCSTHFIHYLFVEKPSLLDNVLITRPSLADVTSLAMMLDSYTEEELAILNKTNQKGISYEN